MKTSTVILVVVGAVVVLVAVLAIAKASAPRPKSTLEQLAGLAPTALAIFA